MYCTYQADRNAGQLNDIGVSHRNEPAKHCIGDSNGGGNQHSYGLVQAQYHTHGCTKGIENGPRIEERSAQCWQE